MTIKEPIQRPEILMKILFRTAFLLLASSSAFAAETPKREDGMITHCQSMMSDPKMAEGMSRTMMDQCHELLKNHGTSDAGMINHQATPAEHVTSDPHTGHSHK